MKKNIKGIPNQTKRPRTYSSCVTHLGDIIDANPSSYGRNYDQRVIVDHEDDDVYDMVSRPEEKFVVSSIWIYKNKCTKQGLWFVSERIDYVLTYSIDHTHFFDRSIYQAKNHLYRICFVRA